MSYIALDFETYSDVDLIDHGLYNYVAGKHFRVLLAAVATGSSSRVIDFVKDPNALDVLSSLLEGNHIIAHNAGFERAVLGAIGIDLPASRFIDTAVIARGVGAAGKLEAAAPQLLDIDKMEEGKDLIRLFCIPDRLQGVDASLPFDNTLPNLHPTKWQTFINYCLRDAELSYNLWRIYSEFLPSREMDHAAITMEMNHTGWTVDLDLVDRMQQQYQANKEAALETFRDLHDPEHLLNLNSLKQLKEWCAKRGVKATSFDEAHVEKLVEQVDRKLNTMHTSHSRWDDYCAVLDLLRTKQELGGSSLKKLKVIENNTTADGTLKDQYLHLGAGQSFRTTGRGVQMQNLKRLGPEVGDMARVDKMSNEELARNLRQVFTASRKDGRLIVGDFSSVESRGLAYLAGAEKKLDAFRQGLDLYKVLAADIYAKPYDSVSKLERQFGKVGELSCGYQAGPGAVRDFAAGMGVILSEGEAAKLVMDWRSANPDIVEFWAKLDNMLHQALKGRTVSMPMPDGMVLSVAPSHTPQSLKDQHLAAQSIQVQLVRVDTQELIMVRFFHGCYLRGNSICYYKPSVLKSGDLWSKDYVNPKTKQRQFHSIYGGKLAGILTQSFCRELFFRVLGNVEQEFQFDTNVKLVGQFHDEIVLDWTPWPGMSQYQDSEERLRICMSKMMVFPSFPLTAEVHSDYRYIK